MEKSIKNLIRYIDYIYLDFWPLEPPNLWTPGVDAVHNDCVPKEWPLIFGGCRWECVHPWFFYTYKTFNEKNVQRDKIFTLSVKRWLVSDAYFEFTKIFESIFQIWVQVPGVFKTNAWGQPWLIRDPRPLGPYPQQPSGEALGPGALWCAPNMTWLIYTWHMHILQVRFISRWNPLRSILKF